MPNKQGWDHDGTIYRVFSDDVEVLETPFPTSGDPAGHVLGKDPATGRPQWTAALAPATITDIVPPDTGPLPLPLDTVIATAPKVSPTPVPDPVLDTCPQITCGAAQQMAVKLREQYDLIRGLLQFMLSAPFLVEFPYDADFEFPLIEWLLVKLTYWVSKNAAPEWVILVVQEFAGLARSGVLGTITHFEPSSDAMQSQLALLAYGVLDCHGGVFKLTPEMTNNWAASINDDTVDFADIERHLLVYCVQFSPFQTYDLTARSGAQNPSGACSGWTGP